MGARHLAQPADGLDSGVSRSLAISLGVALAVACESPSAPDARQSAWSTGPDVPRPVLAAGVAALGLEIAVAGGFDTGGAGAMNVTAEVDVFDSAAGTWGKLPDAPVRWTDANLIGVGDTLYLAGGIDAQRVAHGEVYALDPLSRRWHTLPPLPPGDERGAAGAIGVQNRIYLLGGASSTGVLDRCVQFDIAQQSWTALPPLPAPRAHPAAMRRSDGWLIVAGGFASLDASEPRSEVWGLPPLGTAWQPLAAMHVPGASDARGGCAYGVVLGGLICAGGEGAQAASKVVERYDPYLDEWTVREPMPVERAGTQGAALGGRLFVPGGAGTLSLDPTDTLYIYTPLDTPP